MSSEQSIKDRLDGVLESIAGAAARAGRSADEITLVGVSKKKPASAVREAIEAGLLEVGENRVQEAEAKFGEIRAGLDSTGPPVRWHMVGHLQRNKAKTAVELFDMIQSIDSVRLARAVDKAATARGKVIDVLVEVNTSGERSKFGVSPGEAIKFVRNLADLKGLRVRGLMTVGPLTPDPERARPAFRSLRELAEAIRAEGYPWAEIRYLSMGMTADMGQAIEEGSNMVRVGTGIFGRRAQG